MLPDEGLTVVQFCIFRYAECGTVRKTIGEPVFPTADTLVPGIFVTQKTAQ